MKAFVCDNEDDGGMWTKGKDFDKRKMFVPTNVDKERFDWQAVLSGYFWRRCQEHKTAEFVFFTLPNI